MVEAGSPIPCAQSRFGEGGSEAYLTSSSGRGRARSSQHESGVERLGAKKEAAFKPS